MRADDAEEGDDEAAPGGQPGSTEAPGGGGFLSGWVRSIKTSVVGTAALTSEDIAPALLALKGRLMERNVAENIAERCGAASIIRRVAAHPHKSRAFPYTKPARAARPL